MPQSIRILNAVSLLLVAILLCGSSAGRAWASQADAPRSFRETYREWLQCREKGADGAAWSRVVASFSHIARVSTDFSEKKQSLFFAGKAGLSLYERSGRVADLERAIGHLSEYAMMARRPPRARVRPTPRRPSPGRSQSSERAIDHGNIRVNVPPPAGVGTRSPQWWQEEAGTASPSKVPPQHAESKQKPVWAFQVPSSQGAFQGNPFWQGPRPQFRESPRPDKGTSCLPRQPGPNRAQAKPRESVKPRGFVVVVDPGHGGKDPGAVSRDGRVKEKDVTLEIARRMKRELEGQGKHIKVVLTRTDDSTMSLASRTSLANSLDADLFISIHCNSIDDTVSKGIETFYLSPASSATAMQLAARENGVSLSKMDDLQAVLLDLSMTSQKAESDKLAHVIQETIIEHLGGQKASSADRGVRQAPFRVLLGAKMPAVLVECAFISNPREKRKLQDPHYLSRLAQGMAAGACIYAGQLSDIPTPSRQAVPVASTRRQ